MTQALPTTFCNRIHLLLTESGSHGGAVSPSVYDTAQVLRLGGLAAADTAAVVTWLLEQQRDDGAWGPPHQPTARDLPTVAALLALYPHQQTPGVQAALAHGRAFLAQQPPHWQDPLPDDIPVGIELLLPPLVQAAVAAGVIAPYPMDGVRALGAKRLERVARLTVVPGSTLSHSWEALHLRATAGVLDGSGGVGHSPAATAAWLASGGRSGDPLLRSQAQEYLIASSAATGSPVFGLQPTVWPIDYFELLWVLNAVAGADLLQHPAVAPSAQRLLHRLQGALSPCGLGMSRYFSNDGDITATALATLQLAGTQVDISVLDRFAVGDHFATYPHELQPSLSTTTHALQAYALAGNRRHPALSFLAQRQAADGRWDHDKWHSSWLYTTSVVIHALVAIEAPELLHRGIGALLNAQHADGGWGVSGRATGPETAYAALALRAAQRAGCTQPGLQASLQRAGCWLLAYDPAALRAEPLLWIGKELYNPYRVDAAWILAAQAAHLLADDS